MQTDKEIGYGGLNAADEHKAVLIAPGVVESEALTYSQSIGKIGLVSFPFERAELAAPGVILPPKAGMTIFGKSGHDCGSLFPLQYTGPGARQVLSEKECCAHVTRPLFKTGQFNKPTGLSQKQNPEGGYQQGFNQQYSSQAYKLRACIRRSTNRIRIEKAYHTPIQFNAVRSKTTFTSVHALLSSNMSLYHWGGITPEMSEEAIEVWNEYLKNVGPKENHLINVKSSLVDSQVQHRVY